jgi:hypothetical protein
LVGLFGVAAGLCKAAEANQDPLEHERLVQAYAYARNADAITKGAPREKLEVFLKAGNGLANLKLRSEIRLMVNSVRSNYSKVPTEAAQTNIIAHIRMVRAKLMGQGKVSFEEALKLTRKRAGKMRKDNPAADLSQQIDAIEKALSAPKLL